MTNKKEKKWDHEPISAHDFNSENKKIAINLRNGKTVIMEYSYLITFEQAYKELIKYIKKLHY